MTRLRVAAVAALLAVATATAAVAQDVKWKMANPWPNKHPATDALVALLADVKARTGGKVEIEMVHLDAIGYKQGDLLRVIRQGVTEMGLFVPYYVGRDAPKLANVAPSGALIEPDDNWKIEKIQRAYAESVLQKDWNMVMPMRFFNRGGQQLVIIAREPINTLAGLKGKKVRHFERPGLRAMQTLDIAAQTIGQSELYLALKTGVVDAAVHGLTNSASQSMHEVTCCFAIFTPFTAFGAPYGFVVRKDHWDKVPEPLREAMRAASEADWVKGLAAWRAQSDDIAATKLLLERGMKDAGVYSIEDRKTLQKAVLSVWRDESQKLGADALEMYDKAAAALGAAN
jgi:TRAP-type C4-dicarboxylate transport system substrate-binding protein